MIRLPRLRPRPPRPGPFVDLTGRVCLVTGATSGHGLACARRLAELGAAVVLLGRNPDKCRAARDRIAAAVGAEPEILVCDLSARADIDRAAAEWLERGRPLHLLLNNAGVVRRQRELTADGAERTFAVNYLAPFQLTLRLLPRLCESAPARIVNVASDAHRVVSLPIHDLDAERRYNFMLAYCHSKLAILYFTYELARRLAGSGVTVNAVDPGPVASEIADDNPGLTAPLASWLIKRIFPSPERAAATAMHLCAAANTQKLNGTYWRFMAPQQPRFDRRRPWLGETLWRISAERTGADWPAPAGSALRSDPAGPAAPSRASAQRSG